MSFSTNNIQKKPTIQFIDKFYDWIKNSEWREGYDEVKKNEITKDDLEANDNLTLWALLKHLFDIKTDNEEYYKSFGNNIFERIANFVQNNHDIELCTLKSLNSMEDELGVMFPVNYDIPAPLEIKELLNIFSINKTYILPLIKKFNEGEDEVSVRRYNILTDNSTKELWEIIENNGGDDETYLQLIENVFGACLRYYSLEYEKLYLSDFRDEKIADYQDHKHHEVVSLKLKYKIDPSFQFLNTAQQYIDREIEPDELETNQRVAIEEYLRARKYELEIPIDKIFEDKRKAKTKRYISFIERISRKANLTLNPETLENIHGDYYKIDDPDEFYFKNNCEELIENCAKVLRNIAVEASYRRQYLKFVAQKHTFIGTNTLLRSIVSDFMAKRLTDPSWWRLDPEVSYFTDLLPPDTLRTIESLGQFRVLENEFAGEVRIIEYWDHTEYFNIETNDQEHYSLNPKYWTGSEKAASKIISEHSEEDIIQFMKTVGVDDSHENILDFMNEIYNVGNRRKDSAPEAVPNNQSYNDKYMGIPSADFPAGNIKNELNPSIAIIPFIYNLTGYYAFADLEGIKEYLFVQISDLIENDYPAEMPSVEDDKATTDKFRSSAVDENGFTVNAWKTQNQEFTAYNTVYELSRNKDSAEKINYLIDYNGPYIPDALRYIVNHDMTQQENLDEFYNIYFSENLQYVLYSRQEFEDKFLYEHEETESAYNKYMGVSVNNNITGRRIYDYGLDSFETEYFLFKDESEFETPGEVWVKFKNHPIAMPFNINFDIYSDLDEDNELNENGVCYRIDDDSQLIASDTQLDFNRIKEVSENCYQLRVLNDYIVMYGLDSDGIGCLIVMNVDVEYSNELSRYRYYLRNYLPWWLLIFPPDYDEEMEQIVGFETYQDDIIIVTKRYKEIESSENYNPYKYDYTFNFYIVKTTSYTLNRDIRILNLPYAELHREASAARTANYHLATGYERITISYEYLLNYSREFQRPWGGNFNDIHTHYPEMFYDNGIAVFDYDYDGVNLGNLKQSGFYMNYAEPGYMCISNEDGMPDEWLFYNEDYSETLPEDYDVKVSGQEGTIRVHILNKEHVYHTDISAYERTVGISDKLQLQQFDL